MAVERHSGVYIPTEKGKRHEPMVGPGISVWAVVGYLRTFGDDVAAVARVYSPDLAEDDVRAAREYYQTHRKEVDAKLSANSQLDVDYAEWGLT